MHAHVVDPRVSRARHARLRRAFTAAFDEVRAVQDILLEVGAAAALLAPHIDGAIAQLRLARQLLDERDS